MNEYKSYGHNPPHLFIPNAKYFITVSTYNKKPFLKSSVAKEKLYDSLQIEFYKHKRIIEDWVILDNHYHLMVNAPSSPCTLPEIFKEAHRFTALWIKKNLNIDSIKIFHNYWDTCITYEKSYFGRLNYLWYNPVKHGYVDSPEKGKFGSYYYRFIEDEIKMKNLLIKYPFDKIKIYDDF